MEKLWAPWRIEYIKNEKKNDECIFCCKPLENDHQKNLIVYQGKTCYVIMNYYPYNNGHLMIVPYRHLADLSSLSSDEKIEIMELLEHAVEILKQDMSPHGFNIGVNLGEVAGAGIVNHLHYHVVPRWKGDTNFMPVTGHTKVISEALEETYQRLQLKFKTKLEA